MAQNLAAGFGAISTAPVHFDMDRDLSDLRKADLLLHVATNALKPPPKFLQNDANEGRILCVKASDCFTTTTVNYFIVAMTEHSPRSKNARSEQLQLRGSRKKLMTLPAARSPPKRIRFIWQSKP